MTKITIYKKFGKQLYICILARASWNAPVMITKEAKEELLFWKENGRNLNASG